MEIMIDNVSRKELKIKIPKELGDKFSLIISNKKTAFGILKNRIKNPVEWQKKIREDNDRDIYKTELP